MLRVHLNIKDVVRQSDSPSVSFLSLAAIAPGTPFNVVKVLPSKNHFYIYLPSVNDHPKPYDDETCIFPAEYEINYNWPRELSDVVCEPCDERGPVHCTDSILHIVVYETVSDPTPVDTTNGAATTGGKPLGEWEAYALENNPRLQSSASASESSKLSALKKLGYDNLATVRVGQARISIVELAKMYLLSQPIAAKDSPLPSVTIPLMDTTDQPQTRGKIELTIEPNYYFEWAGQPMDCVNEYLARGDVQQRVEEMAGKIPTFTQKSYEMLIRNAEQNVYYDYVEEYVKMFPPVRKHSASMADEEFAVTGSHPLGYTASSGDEVTIVGRLRAAAPNITAMHAPVTSVDGDLYMPMGFYYREPIARAFISDRHEEYLGPILDMVCKHFGTTSEEVAKIVHAWLDKVPRETPVVAKSLSLKMAACIRIFGLFVTHLNTTFKYRTDFSDGNPRQEGDAGVRIREDTSNDLLNGMNSEDCDGMDKAVQAICFIIRTGDADGLSSTQTWREHDRLVKCLDLVADKYRGNFFQGDIGGWDHPGLDAFQRLLFYYTPLSLVGATTMNFPNDRTPVGGMPRINVDDLDQLGTAPPEEIKKLYYATGEMGQLECHRWSILLPFQTVVDSLVLCIDKEDAADAKRDPVDQKKIDILLYLHQTLRESLPFPLLPPITLEGTVPTNPFALVGASAWMDPTSNDTSWMRRQEAANRRMSMLNKNGNDGSIVNDAIWFERGVIPIDEGPCQWLPGDDPKRRCSLFYKMATCANIPFLDELFGGNDFTCSFVSADCQYFGVEIENILGLRPEPFGLVLPLHRIPARVRSRADGYGEVYEQWKVPAQFCVYSPLNVSMPKASDTMWHPAEQGEFDAGEVFRRQMVSVNKNIISETHLAEFEAMLKRTTSEIRLSEEKLQPYGPKVAIYSYSMLE